MSALSERDAKALAERIVKELRSLGVGVRTVGVHLERDGFWFMADIAGHVVWARTGEGNFTYRAVALELAAAALKATDDPAVHVA